jgi:hypothetical protein
MPASTPDLAATLKAAAVCQPAAFSSPAPGSPPVVLDLATAGCSKAQRWGDDYPPSGKTGGDAPPSFLEVLLSGVAPAAASQESSVSNQMALVAAGGGSPRTMCRIILLEDAHGHERAARAPDANGWAEVESRHMRKERRHQELRPCRLILADLRGKCFNCFSLDHRAASCRSNTRCFRCHTLCRHSFDCSWWPDHSHSEAFLSQWLV